MNEHRPEKIIDRWPTLSDFAKAAGVSYGAAKQMRRRNSIPVQYWPALIEAAKAIGIDLDAEMLMAAHVSSGENGEAA